MISLRGAVSGFFEGLQSKAPNAARPGYALASGAGVLSSTGTAIPSGQLAQLGAYGTVGWLFATVNRIAASVASTEWHLYRRTAEGGDLVVNHPLLDLWSSVNPFFTREEFVETFSQHLELAGEAWLLLVRQGTTIKEIWPLRPDRMQPIPDRDGYLRGYIYRIGSERIPLELDDVIFIRQPNPLDPYRGMSVVHSIMADLNAERQSARWTSKFFENSATPGGYIEYDEEISEEDWERLVKRWNDMHKGVGNAHRVAIIEGGRFHEAKYTQRDMQFTDLRRVNREIILGAFGVPQHILGISESVNRANAEAAEVMFSRHVIVPRLRRIKASLNTRLAPFFDPNLYFDFVDPTPLDRVADLTEADRGYSTGLLTQNEARRLLGYGEVEGGDEFQAPSASPFMLGSSPPSRPLPTKTWSVPFVKVSETSKLERQIGENWARRLAAEAAALTEFVGNFFKGGAPTTKIELSDISGYDWNWWDKYALEVTGELTELFAASIMAAYPDLSPTRAQTLAQAYAETRGAQLLQVTGDFNLAEITRQRVNVLVARTIEQGDSLRTLQQSLRADVAFSPSRAMTVARTETATALGQGERQAALEQDRDEKRWISQGDDVVTAFCVVNERAGWIGIGDKFPSGVDTIPQHPNCRCVVRYRTTVEKSIGDVRCPKCKRLLVKDGHLSCNRCKTPVAATNRPT